MASRTGTVLGVALSVGLGDAGAAHAHHEAIFGPQSALVLSAPAFASVQMYSRQLGTTGARTAETTLVLSAGMTPLKKIPLSLTVVVPASRISSLDGQGDSRQGVEDIVLATRYRYDFGADGNYVMGMAGIEVPVGSVDHPAFDGPIDEMAALMASVERGPLSAIGYALYRHHGRDGAGVRAGDNLFLGTGAAFTPWDDPATERLISFQVGASYETYFRDEAQGVSMASTGGRGLYAHTTLAWGPGGHVLVFATAAVPVVQDYAATADRDRWRIGSGLVFLFGS